MKKLPSRCPCSIAAALLVLAASILTLHGDLQPGTPWRPSATLTPYRARSPEYGMNVFLSSAPAVARRDLNKLGELDFRWQKSLFQWRQIEGDGKGKFDWRDADRIVRASNEAGLKILARVDFQPSWSRAASARNGPPDDPRDYGDFVYALVDRYRTGSPHGRLHALEIWNEPNLALEWGNKKPDPGAYVALLKAGYLAAKRADPSIVVLSAGLAPTGWNDTQMPDDVFLQQMYDAGARDYFDVLGAHAPGFRAPPGTSPEEAAAHPGYGGHRSFTFRRVEDLRAVMERNEDGYKQIWLTEFGWTSDTLHPAYAWFRVTENQKARYVVEAYRWAAAHWAPWIGLMALWNLPDPMWTEAREEYWWSIADADGAVRPAFLELSEARRTGLLPR